MRIKNVIKQSGPVGAGTVSPQYRPVLVPLTDRKKRCKKLKKMNFEIFISKF
jgi:hypothetical protein